MRASAGIFGFFLVVGGLFVGLFSGLMSVVLPWWFPLIFITPPLVLVLGAKWPLLALLFTMLTVFGVMPVPGKAVDLVVFMFIFFAMVVRFRDIPDAWKRYRMLWVTLSVLLAWVGFEALLGLLFQRNVPTYIYAETTTFIYWLIAVPVALIAKDEKSAKSVLSTLIGFSVLMCMLSIAQSLLGTRLNFSSDSRVELLTGDSGGIAGLARSLPPGVMLIFFSFMTALGNLLKGKGRKAIWLPVLLITGMSLLLTFGRALWANVLLASVAVALFSGRRAAGRMGIYGALGIMAFIVISLVFKPDLLDGVIRRITSVFDEGSTNSSLGWRITENYYAMIKIAQSPWLGWGMGAEYKPRLVDMRAFSEQTHYIHNGYFYVLLKTGIIGLTLYLAFYFYILTKCFRERMFQTEDSAPRIALTVTMIAILLLNVTQPELMNATTVMIIAALTPVVFAASQRRSR